MRRFNYNLLNDGNGLILDCLYLCWVLGEITDDEYQMCYQSLDLRKNVERKEI